MNHSIDARGAVRKGLLGGAGDPGYERARSLWNAAIDRHPAVVACPAGARDVAAAVGHARARGLELAVRGGGHSASGASCVDGGMVIDLGARMTAVVVDPQTRRVRCGGGATMADLDAATQRRGLAVTGGTISHTGVGGLALGGGYGYLTQMAGLLVDNLVAAQVVLADGRVVRADADEHPDLLWALRGGGGNFGVVTEFEFNLHPVGPQVHVAMLFWELERCTPALQLARDVCAELPRDAGILIAGLNAAPAPFVPPEHQLAPGIAMILVGFGDAAAHDHRLAKVCARLTPAFEMVQDMPYVALQQMIDGAGPWGMHAYSKGLVLDDLTDDAIAVLADHLPRKSSPMSVLPIFPLGGAYADVPDDATALSTRRSARFNVSIDAIAPTPELMAIDREWVRGLWDALQPFARQGGEYVNFMSEYEPDRIRSAYGTKFDRLAAIKATYDPDNVFRGNANITPAQPTV
ncbi:FAD-binding oxidoreductase [Actinomycetospora sp.]|jgi:FAD/FMN-containing dehydrogenase|uniref:FAD-binding oxidoreductase n=1 Tax=Actinomycetospora sp. TaxID=1872135 RepID=UPI002F41E636